MAGRWWQLVVLVGVVGAIGEALLAISDPGVIVFAAIFAAGAALAYKGRERCCASPTTRGATIAQT